MKLSILIKELKNASPPYIRQNIKNVLKKYRELRNYYFYNILGKTVDKDDIKNALIHLGIKKGDSILVHSSLSRLGKIEGGSKTIVNSLLEIVGPTGNIGAPTFWGLTKRYLDGERNYDVLKSQSILGAVTEIVRSHPAAKRSLHPTHSVAFIGPMAEFIIKNHHHDETPFGRNSPYKKIADLDGKILLLGVTVEYLTNLHTIEDFIENFPVDVYLKEPITFNVIDVDGNVHKVSTRIHCPETAKKRNSLKLLPHFDNAKIIKECKIGLGTARLIEARKLQETLLDLYKKDITMYNI